MPRESREEKTVKRAERVLDDLKNIYNMDGEAYQEYQKLYDEYKRLYSRFLKVLRMNDAMGKEILTHNDQLQTNLDYTIKLAKKKIIKNIEEHKKTKETLQNHTQLDDEIINNLQHELKEVKEYSKKLEHQLGIKSSDKSDTEESDIHHEFYEDIIRVKDGKIIKGENKTI